LAKTNSLKQIARANASIASLENCVEGINLPSDYAL